MFTLISTHPFLGNGNMECSSSPFPHSLTWVGFSVNDSKLLPPHPGMTSLLSALIRITHIALPYTFCLWEVPPSLLVCQCCHHPARVFRGLWVWTEDLWGHVKRGEVPSVSLRSAFSGTFRNHACFCTVCVFTYVLMLDAYCTSTVFSSSHE